MASPFKVKSLPVGSIRVANENFNNLRKYGNSHSHSINIIDINQTKHNPAFNEYAKDLYKVLQFKSVKKFQYKSLVTKSQEPKNFAILLRKLSFRRLEHLSISTGDSVKVKDEHLKPVCRNITKFTKLKTLRLEMYSFWTTKGHFLSPMARRLQMLNKLQSFKLTINDVVIKPENINKFAESLQRLNPQNITDLGFHIGGVATIRDLTVFLTKLGQSVHNFSRLQSLTLNFTGLVDSNAVSSFLEQLSHLKSLTILAIHFLNHQVYETLLKDIIKLQNLKSIDLALFNSNNDDLLIYADSLRQLTSLEEFRLTLNYPQGGIFLGYDPSCNNEINDDTLASLCSSLQARTSHLRVFELIIASNQRSDFQITTLSSRALLSIAELIEKCSKLEHLNLFCASEQEETTLMKLIQSMLTIKNLKTLLLNLRGEDGTNSLLELLGQVILGNSNLTELYIYMKYLTHITDEGVSQVSQAISPLQDLKLFNMELKYSPKLTDITMNNVVGDLKKVKSLERAELCFVLEESKNFVSPPPVLGPLIEGNIKVRQMPFSTDILSKRTI